MKIRTKNSQPFGKKCQKSLGWIFLTHTVHEQHQQNVTKRLTTEHVRVYLSHTHTHRQLNEYHSSRKRIKQSKKNKKVTFLDFEKKNVKHN